MYSTWYNIPIFKNKGVNMSNIINEQILEDLAQEIDNMSSIAIVNEVLDRSAPYSSNPPASDSWDEFFSFADMDNFKNRLMKKRFEEMSR
tara:strand:+ start:132 stop:401 length:270 start_codon:yes stop_codon:yes gene_type:complete